MVTIPPGVGKTMLAVGLGRAADEQPRSLSAEDIQLPRAVDHGLSRLICRVRSRDRAGWFPAVRLLIPSSQNIGASGSGRHNVRSKESDPGLKAEFNFA